MGFAETFKALSDPIRREILMMLRMVVCPLERLVLALI